MKARKRVSGGMVIDGGGGGAAGRVEIALARPTKNGAVAGTTDGARCKAAVHTGLVVGGWVGEGGSSILHRRRSSGLGSGGCLWAAWQNRNSLVLAAGRAGRRAPDRWELQWEPAMFTRTWIKQPDRPHG